MKRSHAKGDSVTKYMQDTYSMGFSVSSSRNCADDTATLVDGVSKTLSALVIALALDSSIRLKSILVEAQAV